MKDITRVLIQMLSGLVDKGFQFPIYMVTISQNGCLLAARYEWSPSTEETTTHIIVEHMESEQMELPINCFFVDRTGNAETTKITTENLADKVAV